VDNNSEQEWNNIRSSKFRFGKHLIGLIQSYSERLLMLMPEEYGVFENDINENTNSDDDDEDKFNEDNYQDLQKNFENFINNNNTENNENNNESSNYTNTSYSSMHSFQKLILNIPNELISVTQRIFIGEWMVKEIFGNKKKIYLFNDIMIFANILNENEENKYQYEFEKYIDILDYDVEKTTMANNKTIQFVKTERNKTSKHNNQLIHNNQSHSHLSFEYLHSIIEPFFYFKSEKIRNNFIRRYNELRDNLLNNNNNNNSDLDITNTINKIDNNIMTNINIHDNEVEILNDYDDYNNAYSCTKEFKAKNVSQIDINVDDVVTIKEFTGKYILGKNLTTNKEGHIPIYFIERMDGNTIFFYCKKEMESASVNDEIFLIRDNMSINMYPGYNITKGKKGYFNIDNLEQIIMDDEILNEYEALYYNETVNDNSLTDRESPKKVDRETIENGTIENETVENETIENETIENEIIENEIIENETIENEKTENEKTENEKTENEKIDLKKLEKEIIRNEKYEKSIKGKLEENKISNIEKMTKEKILLNNNDNILHNSSTLVVATSNFESKIYDHLNIKKNENLIVTDWNYKKDWVYGHRKDNEEDKGMFPKMLIKILNEKTKGNTENLIKEKLEKKSSENEKLEIEKFAKEKLPLNNNDDKLDKSSTLVFATENFESQQQYDQLDIDSKRLILNKN